MSSNVFTYLNIQSHTWLHMYGFILVLAQSHLLSHRLTHFNSHRCTCRACMLTHRLITHTVTRVFSTYTCSLIQPQSPLAYMHAHAPGSTHSVGALATYADLRCGSLRMNCHKCTNSLQWMRLSWRTRARWRPFWHPWNVQSETWLTNLALLMDWNPSIHRWLAEKLTRGTRLLKTLEALSRNHSYVKISL